MKNEISLQHIHIVANNKYELASWYEEMLGFQIVGDIEKMGEEEGPLVISGDGGKTAISIFDKQERHNFTGTNCLPAFELEPAGFVFLFKKIQAADAKLKIFNHYLFYSFYYEDPSGTKIELTCLKFERLTKLLLKEKIGVELMTPLKE